MDKPEPGKVYALTGAPEDACMSNGNTWEESEVEQNRRWAVLDASVPCAHTIEGTCDYCGGA